MLWWRVAQQRGFFLHCVYVTAPLACYVFSLSAQLPHLASLLLQSSSSCHGNRMLPSLSASALRLTAEAATACSSRLTSAHPLLAVTGVRLATTGLWAVAKAFLSLAAAAGSISGHAQQQQQHFKRQSVTGLLRQGLTSFPSLPFANVACGDLYEAMNPLPTPLKVQWLLCWLRAEATTAAANNKSSKVVAGPPSRIEPAHKNNFASARLVAASLLQQLAQRHLAWRRQQEIAADQTATLLQRLEGLVVDRSAVGGVHTVRRDAETAAQELFPSSNEWGETEQQQHQQLMQEDAAENESTQYTTWCQQATDNRETDSQQQQQQALQQMDGLSETDLLQLWGHAVETGLAWSSSSSSSKDGADGEREEISAYREALAVSDL